MGFFDAIEFSGLGRQDFADPIGRNPHDLRIREFGQPIASPTREIGNHDIPTQTQHGLIKNVTNQNAWRESPFQFGHSYLFPMTPRTFALSLQASL